MPIQFQTGRPTLALNGPALNGLTLCGPMDSSCRVVSGIMPDWRPRPGPMADFSSWAGMVPRTARCAAIKSPPREVRARRRRSLAGHRRGGGSGAGRRRSHRGNKGVAGCRPPLREGRARWRRTPVLTQNQYPASSTQQAERSWLNPRANSKACQSIFLKLTKEEKTVR
jgi:hypothetical protein